MTEVPTSEVIDRAAVQTSPRAQVRDRSRWADWRVWGSFRNISALYIFAAIFLLFALWIPDLFLTESVWRSLLDQQALTALVAMGLVLPLAAGVFNLAVGAEVGFGAIFVAWLLSNHGVPLVPAVLLTLVAGACIGAVSGALITRAGIDSFIATLGMSSVLLAAVAWLSSSQQILGLSASFQRLATQEWLGVTSPVWAMLIVALGLSYLMDRTPAGRRIYATGGNVQAARLAGVRTDRIVVLSLMGCGALAAAAGLLASSRLASGDPTIGPAYLLPAYAAAFLGSTQFRRGRYNIWGTLVAAYVLATGVKGLQLAGAPVWIPELFNGLALLLAVGLARHQRAATKMRAVRRLLPRRRQQSAES